MLAKLYKHEFYRLFKSMFFVLIAVAITCGFVLISLLLPDSLPYRDIVVNLTIIPYFLSLVLSIGVTLVVIVINFYKSMFSPQGYLTFTLPFKNTVHLYSKLITGIIMLLLVIAVDIITLEPVFRALGLAEYAPSSWNLSPTLTGMDPNGALLSVEFPILLFLPYIIATLAIIILLFFSAMCIGQIFKSRGIATVVSYFSLYTAGQLLSLIAFVIVFINTNFFTDFSSVNFVNTIFALTSILALIEIISMLVLCRYSINRRLNLE